jgi:hypothetical protein
MAELTPEELKKQIEEANKKLKEASGFGYNLADAFGKAGDNIDDLKKLLVQINKELSDTVDSTDYIYRSFKSITAELKGQNILLKDGKNVFKTFSDIAQNINYFQRGNLDLSDKQFKKLGQSLKVQTEEFKIIKGGLEAGKETNESIIAILEARKKSEEGLNAQQEARLKQAKEEISLLNEINQAEGLIPTLQKELDLSKSIFKVREDMGGIATSAAKTVAKFGGSLSQFLNVNDAITSVEEYNKKVVTGALNNKKVQGDLLALETQKKAIQDKIITGEINSVEEIEAANKKILDLENQQYKIREKAVKQADNIITRFKSLGILTKEIGAGLLKSITDPTTILTTFITLAFKADKQITQLANSLGISKQAATGLRNEFVNFAVASNDVYLNAERLIKAQSELSEQLGITVRFSKEELATFSKLTGIVGLTADEATKLDLVSKTTGVTLEQYEGSLLKSALYAGKAANIHLSAKQTLQEVSKLSSLILLRFQGNPDALSKAVVQAKALGTNLQQINQIGESLLNFESSIENELKAELLTGRQLNLERARYAALTGNQLELTQAITEEVGSLADFQNMNVIAQQSLAQAFGLSAEQLGDMLFKQDALNKYGDKAKDATNEQIKAYEKLAQTQKGLTLEKYLIEQSQQLEIQEQFNNSMIKLQEIISTLATGPIIKLAENLATMANNAYVLKGVLMGIVAISFGKILMSLGAMAVQLGISAAGAITTAAAITMGIGLVAIIAGIAEGMTALSDAQNEAKNTATQQTQDGIAPSSKGPFTITDSYGATAITAKGDNVVVSPNVNKSLTPLPQSIPQNAVKETIIQQRAPMANYGITKEDMKTIVSDLLTGLLNKPQPAPTFIFEGDGAQLGKFIGSQIETGTAQNISTGYKLA